MPRKRAKNSNNTSKWENSFEALAGMPLDIIFEIFGYLDPLDLLRLARTTKTIRAILMSRSSLPLWKRVRHTYYQMPDGPEGMSEPQYVSLALDNICDGCGSSTTRRNIIRTRTMWNARLRSCCSHECESALFVGQSRLRKIKSSKVLPRSVIGLLEVSNSDLRYSFKQTKLWEQQYSSLNSSSAKLEWETQILKESELSKQYITSFSSWIHARNREIAARRARLGEEMGEALLVRLRELGWGEEIGKMSQCDYFFLKGSISTNDPEDFPQAWTLNGRAILDNLKATQTARLEKEWKTLLSPRYKVLQSIYHEYICGLPANALLPNIADLALSPPINAVLTDKRTDFNVTWETFKNINLVQILPSVISDWKTRLEGELVQMMKVKLSKPITKDHLLLATTIFYCDKCNMNLFYPRVLVHRCSTPYMAWPAEMEPANCPAWNSSKSIMFNLNVHLAAVDIIHILGLDPKVTTAEDMAARNSVLQCMDCRKTRQGRQTMVWSRAIDHSWFEHRCRPTMISWKVPGHQGQLMLQASLAQELVANDDFNLARPRFMCGQCRYKTTLGGLKSHLLTEHSIQDPDDNDISLNPDAIHVPLPCVLPETD